MCIHFNAFRLKITNKYIFKGITRFRIEIEKNLGQNMLKKISVSLAKKAHIVTLSKVKLYKSCQNCVKVVKAKKSCPTLKRIY